MITAIQPPFQHTFSLIWRPREKSVERRIIIQISIYYRLNVVNIFIEARQTLLKEIQVWENFRNVIFLNFFLSSFRLTAALNIYNFVQKLYPFSESTCDHIMGQGGAIQKRPGPRRKIRPNPYSSEGDQIWESLRLYRRGDQTPTQYTACICLAVFICFFVCYVFHINTRYFFTQNPLL